MFPNNIPNLNQILLNGFNKFEFNIPKIRNTNEIINDQILISWLFNNGQIAKTKKRVIDYLLFMVPALRDLVVLSTYCSDIYLSRF